MRARDHSGTKLDADLSGSVGRLDNSVAYSSRKGRPTIEISLLDAQTIEVFVVVPKSGWGKLTHLDVSVSGEV